MDIRFLGHAAFELFDGQRRVLIDPFITGNPRAPVGPGDLERVPRGHQPHPPPVELDRASTTPKGTVNTPAGMVIRFGGRTVYHLGDTALFSDLALPGARDELDVALVCIGGHYTMDRHGAATAAGLVGARTVIPCHYDTFPPIETDVEAFRADVESSTASDVIVLEPGASHSL